MLLRFSVLTPEVRAIRRTLDFGCIGFAEEIGQVDDGVELHLQGIDDAVIRGWMAVFVLASRLAHTMPSANSVDHAVTLEWIALESSADGFARLESHLADRMSGDAADPQDGAETPVWLSDFDATTAADILWIERIRAMHGQLSPILIRYMRQDPTHKSEPDTDASELQDGGQEKRGVCHVM